METMDSWDLVLLVVAGYVATVALVRLMTQRRDQMLQRLRKQIRPLARAGYFMVSANTCWAAPTPEPIVTSNPCPASAISNARGWPK